MASTNRYSFVALVAVILGLLVFAGSDRSPLLAQQTGSSNPPLVIPSLAGRDLFEFYCATCHGRDAHGNGPAAKALRIAPPDLTMLAAHNRGTFPRASVHALISGERDVPAAHGSREMPVWGPIFHGLDANDRLNRVRIDNIVEYLSSVQTK